MFARATSRLERPVRRYDPFAQRQRKAVEVQALVMAKPAFEEIRGTAGGVPVRLWPHYAEGLRYALRFGSGGAQKIDIADRDSWYRARMPLGLQHIAQPQKSALVGGESIAQCQRLRHFR